PWWRRVLKGVLGIAIALTLLVGTALWLASRPWAAEWLAEKISAHSGGTIELDGVEGTLLSGLSIRTVRFANADQLRISIDALRFTWFWVPRDLFVVPELAARRIVVEPAPPKDDEPARPPASLALPVEVQVRRIAVDEIVIAKPDSRIEVRDLLASWTGGRGGHALTLERVRAFGVEVSAQARIQGMAPFETVVDAQARLPDVPQIAAVAARVEGPLAALRVGAAAQLAREAGSVTAHALVRPFERVPVAFVDARARDVRLARALNSEALDATLSFEARLRADGTTWRGPIELVNAMPGALDAGRLPVERIGAELVAGEGARLEFIVATLPQGGRITGRATLAPKPLAIALNVRDVALNALHGALVPIQVAGPIEARIGEGGRVDARVALAGAGLALDATARSTAERVDVESFALRAGEGQVAGQARVELAGRRRVTLTAQAERFDIPRVIGALAQSAQSGVREARLDGTLTLEGEAAPPQRFALDMALARLRIAGLDVAGQARGVVRLPERGGEVALSDIDVSLQAAENTLTARGAYGGRASNTANGGLVLAVRAPRIDRFAALAGVPLAGQLIADAAVAARGRDLPNVNATLALDGLRVGDEGATARVDRLNATAVLSDARLRFNAQAAAVSAAGVRLDQARADLNGVLGDHVFTLEAVSTMDKQPARMRVEAAGGWRGGREQAWIGQIRQLANDGALPVRLVAPAPVTVSAREQRIDGARIDIADGRLTIDRFQREGERIRTSGGVEHVPVRIASRWVERLRSTRNTLALGGRWNLDIGERIDGEVRIARENGDLAISDVAASQLGLTQLELVLNARANAITAKLDANAARAGAVHAELNTTVSRRDGRWGIAGATPLNYRVQGVLSSLDWVALVVDTPLRADGRVTFDIARSGPIAQPRLQGALVGERLSVQTFEPRAALREGQVRVVVFDNRLSLDQFEFKGRGGTLTGKGAATFGDRGPEGAFNFAIDKLDALTDPQYKLLASGGVDIALRKGTASITGEIRVDEARLRLTDTGAPTLGNDVVVVRDDPKRRAQDEGRPAQRPVPVNVDLRIDLGKRFEISGFGATASLTGALQLTSNANQPLRGIGTIEITSGTYAAYGQDLEIKRGQVVFSGPLDNPGLSIVAERPRLPVQVGVEVTGALRQPKITLYSKPEMTNTEKLSWLVLGRGVDNATRGDLQTLGLAASALFSRGDGPSATSRIARAVGVDEISLRGSTDQANASGQTTAESAVVAIGKRLTDRLYLTFERSLAGTSTVAKLKYEVARRWSVQTSAGTDNALDVFYTVRFD
ncbi:MAG TPA: translocation/assembly module TamB domain-containing protein, partial [Burkholderiaceae bacterium]|nr:translocation/assembly module TamB domain-containing protein [Burkholderiaceae bacterium]